jgi:hypothetical protein
MAASKEFFISYTGADQAWAEVDRLTGQLAAIARQSLREVQAVTSRSPSSPTGLWSGSIRRPDGLARSRDIWAEASATARRRERERHPNYNL